MSPIESPAIRFAKTADRPHRLVPVTEGAAADFPALPEAHRALARALAEARKFAGKPESVLLVPTTEGQWCFAGLGPAGEVTRPRLAEAVARGLAALREAGAHEIALVLPEPGPEGLPWPGEEAVRYGTEALMMAAYRFDRHRSKPPETPPPALSVCGGGADAGAGERGVTAGGVVGDAVALARDLINEPAAVAHPDYLAVQAREVADAVGATFHTMKGDALLQQGYGAIHAVGRAAEHPPALVTLEWAGGDGPTLALVGKGVTFDTGGLDIKPSNYMALMKKDMGGAATVLGAFRGIARLGLPLRVVAVLGLAENVVDARSYRPGDILRSKAGLTIEITNTDAEGRVVLADALALARTHRPDYMVDLATLTGACRIALGKDVMGLFCDHDGLREALQAAAAHTGDAVWPLPLWAPYRKKLDSPVADLVNAAPDGMAGAVTAALFLQEFATPGAGDEVAWAHLDCYAWSDGDTPLFPKGGSGAGVRLLIDLAHRLTTARP